ncbi:ACP S-malonyltransferase [Phormidium yuhuli AB48]|uniref:Malonyl CoA-acyl carrier protein transacylase n=2 Tax=Phormidium TaxID=1198 RepID=A0ABY5AXV3_9CYAN|nr:ACP S-malonyltransferase [Phormidium yuhuli]USR93069.1 ACP S-malonyltransferase [Phormidium yuhuli AB48]
MMKTAWVFPGQGSQAVGMGVDLAALPEVAERFQQAEAILGWSVVQTCETGENLSETRYTQPCLYTVECALVDLLRDRGVSQPDLVAGHSLGEYVALYAAGVLDFETGLKLVKRRGELMSQASEGQMTALMKFDRPQLEDAIAKTEGVVLANDNSPLQVVISGTEAAIAQILSQVKVRRSVPLDVSGAFHSPLMEPAAAEFQTLLEPIDFKEATIPVLSNVDPSPETSAAALKTRLQQQMTGSVRWREIVLSLPDLGIEQVLEVGPGKVLSGLVGRTVKELNCLNVGTVAELDHLTESSL